MSKNNFVKILVGFLVILSFSSVCIAEADYPLFVSEIKDISKFGLFATSGWDGNWYVGYNHGWISKLPPIPERDNYKRAYIGAMLGRAKRHYREELKDAEKKNDKKGIKELRVAIKREEYGTIYIGLNSEPSWGKSNTSLLTSIEDIPLEGDSEEALEGVGEARWFWVEVPLKKISPTEPNFIALWSKDEHLNSRENSPILAAGWGGEEKNSWLDDKIEGVPPTQGKPITIFEPALAIKLVPKSEKSVVIKTYKKDSIIYASVEGVDITKTWIEVKVKKKWEREGKYMYNPPYIFNIETIDKPVSLRIAGVDLWGNVGYSEVLQIE